MSIRNLSGAPSFGSSDIGVGRSSRRRTNTADGHLSSSIISRFSHSLNSSSAGDNDIPNHNNSPHKRVRSDGTSPSSQSFAYRPQHRYNVSNSYNIRDRESIIKNRRSSTSSTLSPPPPPPSTQFKTPSPNSSSFRNRLRSKTWDSASRLSPANILSKSNSFGAGSDVLPPPMPSTSTAPSSSLPNRLSEQFIFENDKIGDVYSSSSSSSSSIDSSSEIEETKEEEKQELEDTLHISPSRDKDKDDDDLTTITSKVTFSEKITEHSAREIDEDKQHHRPSRTAKLTALTTWDTEDDNDNEEDMNRNMASSASPMHSSKAFSHFRHSQQTNNTGLLSKLNPCRHLSWSIVGSCIVRTAPCFWCFKKLGISATDREILLRLNLLCAFFCVIQILIGVFLFVLKYTGYSGVDDNLEDEDKALVSAELWSLELFVYCLSLVNIVLLVASLLAQRAIRDVNLVGSVRYMWTLLWIAPLQIFFMIGLFDYYNVNNVHTEKWWDDPSMSTAREISCPEGTAHDECAVPILGGDDYDNEEEWCIYEYNVTRSNATYCRDIREGSQTEYNVASYVFYTANGIWALLLVVLIWVTLCVLQAIITLPIVQRSKESNIPLWLTFPIIGCYSIGYLLLYSESSVTSEFQDVYWIGLAYFLSGGAFTLAAMVGIFLKCYTVLNGRQRRIKQGVVVFFILTIFVTVFAVATIFTTSLIYSLNIIDFQLVSWREIACFLDSGGSCTGCDQDDCSPEGICPEQICPEWTEDDVKSVLQTIMKQSATLAAIFLVYSLVTLRYGFVQFRHVSKYQIEYV